MSKTSIISSYISRCKKVLEDKDIEEAIELEDEIVSVYDAEIKELTTGLNNYADLGCPREINCLKNIKLLKAKLENYRSNLKRTPIEKVNAKNTTLNINNSLSTSINNEISITLEQTMKNINDIPSNILTDDEKQELEDKLASLQLAVNSKNKEKIRTKLLNVLKFVVNKGPETYIAIADFVIFLTNKVAPLFK